MKRSCTAVDPGKHKCGVAVVRDGTLISADTVGVAELAQRTAPGVWVCETPQHYGNKSVAHADIEYLLLTLERLANRWGPPKRKYLPRNWKGQVPKVAHHNRVRAALTPDELAVFEGTDHNGRDAACLALFYAGRVGVGGTRV